MKLSLTLLIALFFVSSISAQWKNQSDRSEWNKEVEKKWSQKNTPEFNGAPYINDLITLDTYIDPFSQDMAEGRYGTKFYFKYYSFKLPAEFKKGDHLHLRITEVINPLDFYLSRLNLTYNNHSIFESGGMFRIDAFYKGRPVLLDGPGIEVQFPVNNPVNEYNLYSYQNNLWTKKQDSKDIKTSADTTESVSENLEFSTSAINKFVSGIKGFLWWNFDVPRNDMTCITGRVKPSNVKYSITVVGISKLGATTGYSDTEEFKINYLQDVTVKVIIETNNDMLGASNNILTNTVDSYFYSDENKKGKCQNIGEINIEKVSPELKKDRGQLLKYLGLNDIR
ncbi:hypothetical protein JWG41_04200 [Leptospira sp. 201903075]|uniref:hypothetical protein n=1 Tax=Leptospira chreensis TaxID=2810035 RepID=UPI0019632164|nr:hypothetical protein [Leptospira chreensis]MBM9589632.1 hypothetical protein [Leptospira chreensis]